MAEHTLSCGHLTHAILAYDSLSIAFLSDVDVHVEEGSIEFSIRELWSYNQIWKGLEEKAESSDAMVIFEYLQENEPGILSLSRYVRPPDGSGKVRAFNYYDIEVLSKLTDDTYREGTLEIPKRVSAAYSFSNSNMKNIKTKD